MKQILSHVLVVVVLLIALHVIHHPTVVADTDDDLKPLITTSELIVGQNRFAFGLIKGNKLLERAAVRVRIYSIDGPEPRLVAETNAAYRAIGSMSGVDNVHRHEDGTTHEHGTGSDVRGLYTTHVTFAGPEDWGVEIEEWRLTSEPWIFIVDSRGIISAKFEGLVTVQELDHARQRVTASGASH